MRPPAARDVAGKQGFLHRTIGAEIDQFLGELLDERRRRQATIVAQHLGELQSIHHRFTAGVVVGEHEGGSGVLLNLLDALLPLLQFFRRIKIIVRGGRLWSARPNSRSQCCGLRPCSRTYPIRDVSTEAGGMALVYGA